jgi:hypothetical protein
MPAFDWPALPAFSSRLITMDYPTTSAFDWESLLSTAKDTYPRSDADSAGLRWADLERQLQIEMVTPGIETMEYANAMAAPAGGSWRLDIYVHGESNLPLDRQKLRDLAVELRREFNRAGGVSLQ